MQRYEYLARFSCLGEACEDTCCKGWGMQLDAKRVALYETHAPELLPSIMDSVAGMVMRRDEATDYCVEFTQGVCAIHAKRGTDFLGDACHFFPRSVRAFGDETVMSASLSCPEITRLILEDTAPFSLQPIEMERLPEKLNDYLPEGLTSEQAMEITHVLLREAGDETRSAERNMAVVMYLLFQLEGKPAAQYPLALSTYCKIALGMLPAAEPRMEDPYFIIQTLRGLMHASPKAERNRLEQTLCAMEDACEAVIDPKSLDIFIKVGKEDAAKVMLQRYALEWEVAFAPVLRRYLQAQIALAGIPFGGFGRNLRERATILCARFATVRLALMSEATLHGTPDKVAVTRIIQSISRFMDHLADPELSMRYYNDAGWNKESRLRALVGDV